jgi:hypothetical protein
LFIGGIALMILGAVIFFFADTPVPIPIGVLVVGIALVAVSRRRAQ